MRMCGCVHMLMVISPCVFFMFRSKVESNTRLSRRMGSMVHVHENAVCTTRMKLELFE
jgi:hypothetical protein